MAAVGPGTGRGSRGGLPVALAVGALLLLGRAGEGRAGLCPARCRCDDESLRSSCAYGGLDVVPIQLNPEIHHLDLSGNRITSLHTSFDFYSNLESLELGSNLIHTLGTNNFRLQQQLLSLNLSGNSIRSLAKSALHGLACLKLLDLSNNNITDMDEQAFRYTSELERLDLSGNSITSLPEGLLRNLHRIRELVLSGNSLLELPASNLALAPSLERLDLADNLIQELGRGSLPSLPVLRRLSLANNVLRSVSDDAFDVVRGLLSLDLAGNNLTSVPSAALSKLNVLASLVLSSNPLGRLRNLAFKNLFELRELSLDDCAISTVDTRAFADNVNLERISMDGNRQLAELPARVLYAAGNLRYVSLRRCRLGSLQPTQFPVDGLAVLRVGGNPLVCNCSVHWLWEVLRAEAASGNSSSTSSGSRLELDSSEIVCADEEFGGRPLASLAEAGLRCRLGPWQLGLAVLGCVLASLALLALLAHLARLTRSKRVPAYAPPTRPELLVYVGRPGDGIADKQPDAYSRRLIARTEELVYEAANQDYQQCRRKSGSESSESRETNVYETPRYSRPGRRENADGQSFTTFYQERPATPPRPCGYPDQQQQLHEQDAVYAVADVTNLAQPDHLMSLYRMQRHRHRPDYDYDYEPPVQPAQHKPHVVFV